MTGVKFFPGAAAATFAPGSTGEFTGFLNHQQKSSELIDGKFYWFIFEVSYFGTFWGLQHVIPKSWEVYRTVRIMVHSTGIDISVLSSCAIFSQASSGAYQHQSWVISILRKEKHQDSFLGWYCWWKKSCTTWDVKNPANNGMNYLSTGAGFFSDMCIYIYIQYTYRLRPHGDAFFLHTLLDPSSIEHFSSEDWPKLPKRPRIKA